ncbi:MAG TPA: hypothetical protein DCY48_00580 [Candidatus Magasanikbacteria bacterium]|nr:MAG: hypothetical protein A3I74_02520 [Candidatus Magasanikbacteria bacterium RIFCSPLOWO2_02_FULL_47_16]OGH79620.1 MAG: hypothetical protein A3C10_00880 [Candidatus Magasanikbacteria bacterium RIFCSPHIGHO2_02_FULL_48_18]OGH82036.1 MAG: hypothetical protein A3G08_02390 [Candidatus Magasanikbacteria bacterium RIFCSPLOWO2_12_FULL_47_9b]HAZ28259.1 hypothetical protein [Candidatus Magasanikbacteria bacterium]
MTARPGFTLIEVIVVIALGIILLSVSIPLYDALLRVSMLDSSKADIVEQLRLAETKARYGAHNSRFGVYMQDSSYTVFQGNTYATRVVAEDNLFTLPDTITFTANTEITFATSTGLPSATGAITLLNSATNQTETITINEQGLIE